MPNEKRQRDEHPQPANEQKRQERIDQVARELDQGVRVSLQALLAGFESLEPCLRHDESAQRILKGLTNTVCAIVSDVERLSSELQPPTLRLFSLVFEDRVIPLRPGKYVIGRAEDCDIQFDRPRVSRRHAELDVGEYEAHVIDRGSTNGVYVNGRRIEERVRLRGRDVVAIGDQHFEVRSESRGGDDVPKQFGRCELPTLREDVPGTAPVRMGEETEETDLLDVVGTMATRWIDQGRAEDAERSLSGHLRQIMTRARSGRTVRRATANSAVEHALRLALAMNKPDWVHYVLELSTLQGLELSVPAVVTLERLQSSGVELPLEALNTYLERMGKKETSSPEQGYALVRLRRLVIRLTVQRNGNGGRSGA